MFVTKSGQKLADVIKKAIEDSVITMAEYEEIMSVASKDGVIDAHERALLRELNDMIANRSLTLKRDP
jgi:tellurite resistance protein